MRSRRWLEHFGHHITPMILGLVPMLAMHRARHIVWLAPLPPLQTPVDFMGIVVFPVDGVMWLAIGIGLLDWALNTRSRTAEWDLLRDLLSWRAAGVWIALLCWMVLGIGWATDPTLVRYATLTTAAQLLFGLLVARQVVCDHATRLIAVFLVGATLHSLIALAQYAHGSAVGLSWLGEQSTPAGLTEFRAYGLTDNPNSLAGYLAVAWFAALARIVTQDEHRAWRLVAAGIIGAALLSTLSRGGILGTALASLPLLALGGRGLFAANIPRARWLLAVTLASMVIIGAVFTPELLRRLDQTRQRPAGTQETYFLGRNFYVDDTNAVIQTSRWYGVGSNNLMGEIARRYQGKYGTRYPVHNVYWLVRAELGIPGFALFCVACWIALTRLMPLRLTPRLVWACGWLAIMLIMLVEFYFWASPHSRVLLFFVLGMVWGLTRWDRLSNAS